MDLFTYRNLFRTARKCLILYFLFPATLFAQQETWLIYFQDKNNSPYSVGSPEAFLSEESIQRRLSFNIPVEESDLPVNPHYLDSIRTTGAFVAYSSKWLNAALVTGSPEQLQASSSFSFVLQSENLKKSQESNFSSPSDLKISANYGNSLNQFQMVDMVNMHNDGFRGEGVKIAVLDAGFRNVDVITGFDSLHNSGRLIETFDFPDREQDVYEDHEHGTNVLSILAAYKEGEIIGGAWKSKYLLYRTENVSFEKEIEEVYWLLAAERADSAGADIIHSSIGYNTFPDDPSADHTYSDLDGNTAIITKAANMAAAKGILVVNSAGNEGSSSWKYLLVPADGDLVLAVGGVYPDESFVPSSSEGPTYDGRIKPDVAAQGSSVVMLSSSGSTFTGTGTSFAAPIVTGLAAGLWQRFPHLSNLQLLQLIRESADQFNTPDNKKGYGIPSYNRAVQILSLTNSLGPAEIGVFPNPVTTFVDIILPVVINGPVNFSVYDAAGKVVISEEYYVNGKILRTDLSFVYPGLYFGRIEGKNQVWNINLMKAP